MAGVFEAKRSPFPSIPCVYMPQGVGNRIEDGAKLIVCSLQLSCSQISFVCDGWGGVEQLHSKLESCLNCVSLPVFWGYDYDPL